MKRTLIFLLALSLLTACESEEKISTAIADVIETTEAVTESTTKATKTQDYVSYDSSETKQFETFAEFENYMNSDEKEKEFARFFTEEVLAITGGITVFEPIFDESKYEFARATFVGSSYNYSFKNLSTGNFFIASITKSYSPQTFEEMVEAANVNLVVAVENTETTVWGDTPALIQSIPFSEPVEYSIRAMINENNEVYLSGNGMTPEELTVVLNDFTFE